METEFCKGAELYEEVDMIHSIIGIKFNIYTKIHNVTVVHKFHPILDFDGGVVK